MDVNTYMLKLIFDVFYIQGGGGPSQGVLVFVCLRCSRPRGLRLVGPNLPLFGPLPEADLGPMKSPPSVRASVRYFSQEPSVHSFFNLV